MAYTQRLDWEPLRSIDATTFTGAYQAVGTPLTNPSYIIKLVNNSSVFVTISKDGVTDIDVAPANSYWLYDESKAGAIASAPSLPAGTQIFVKGNAGGSGNVYLVSQFIIQS